MSKVKEDTAKVDNTAVVKPKVFERLRVTPRKYELVDLGGTPSNDTRTPAERNKDYLHPIKGAKERFKASMSNETNPLVGIERTILPSAAGAALVTTPIALAKGAGYGFGIDKLTGGWGNMVERTTGIPSEIAQYTNPGAIIGGAAGYRLDQKNLLSKFIKGDADLAWNPINKNHWIFNKEARTASNIGMAVTNRLAPFLQGVEKLPLKVAAHKTAKRTKGNASVTLSEIKGNPSDYAGASILGGGNLEGRNLVAQYIFGENPIIKRVFFNKATSNIKPISNNEAKRWNESPNAPDQVRLTKQAALMDKVGTPFILQQSNPIWIEGRSVRQAMKVGGKFTFKKSPAVKDAEKLNGKRDMRKKFVKSSRPTYKRRIRKGQVGMRFVSYVPVNNPTIDYTDITNPINPFSEYYIPTTYNTEQALVVPEREDSKSDTVEETPAVASKPIAELVVNKPVASKVVVDNTANSTWSSPYKDRSKWIADLTNAYKRAGITNDNAIRMLVSQDALESAWGRSAQGKFNFGNLTTGAKWQGDYVTGNDHDAAGNPIKQKFRSYNSMDEYAADKVQFLKRLYDFDENDDINKFVAKLTGSNKGKRRYAEARNYADTLKKVYNSYRSGGIIKYQEPAQPIARRDAIIDYRPNIPNRIRRATPAEHIQSMIDIYGQPEHQVGSDNRSKWQHGQASKQADKSYNDYMETKKAAQGLDRLNQFLTFTDYAGLATGIGGLASKGLSMAGKQMAKRAVGKEFKRQSKQLTTPANHSLLLDMSGVAPRPLSEFSALSNEELAKLLPDYAHPNWQGDGFKLVKYRLWNGGFDRLEKYGDIPRYSPNLRTDILNSTPKIETSATLGEQPGYGLYRQTYVVNEDVIKTRTPQQAQDVGAHEMVHYMYRPSKEQEAELAYNVRQYFKRPEGRDYFRQSRATEQTARGTQIKNYYGLNEGNQDITPAMWEYARRNYVKDTGITNNMTEWLNSVDERDITAFTKWLSNNSPAIATPIIGGTMYENK